jgi:hypothetical protein
MRSTSGISFAHRDWWSGLAVVQAVDIGQQDHALRARRLRDARGEPVIVAEADFLGRDAVILVDHRHHAEREQPVERRGR